MTRDAETPAWERRFRSGRTGLPEWAVDAPDRCVVVASTRGVLELHSWDAATGELHQATRRSEGTVEGAIDPGGQWIWWFDDDAGDEHGRWLKQPFGSAPGEGVLDATGLPEAYSAGLALGRSGLAVVGSADDGYGTRIHASRDGGPPHLLYEHREDAAVGDLSESGELLAISHSEHGDSRHPALRVVRVADGSTVADLADGPGKGLEVLEFSPMPGDARLLVRHEREGRGGLLLWDPLTGAEDLLELGEVGEVSYAGWFRDGTGLLVGIDHDARTTLRVLELTTGELRPVGPGDGTATSVTTRPDGKVWSLWSSAGVPPAVRGLDGGVVLPPPGDPAPESVSVEDVRVVGPGGPVHALLRRPAGASGPLPLLLDIHGGPTWHDTDAFRPYPSAWVDQGFAVVQVNYRGSTGYGSAWRDALEARVGHVELEDVVAVRDNLVATGVADGDRVVLSGASWGGFLTLLGAGLYPDRWTAAVAGVPVADYAAAYEDEMEGLKAFDRALFGGTPQTVPERYRDASPLTYVDAVQAPVLVLAGENDPRCPIRQIDNYLAALRRLGRPHEVYRYDAGHGSVVDDERVRQFRVELAFVQKHLGA